MLSTYISYVQFEADRRAFIITINSFGTELTMDDREKLYPTCGKLYPDGLARLAKCEDYEQVKAVADCYPVSVPKMLYCLSHCMIKISQCSILFEYVDKILFCRNMVPYLLELVPILERRPLKTSSLKKR